MADKYWQSPLLAVNRNSIGVQKSRDHFLTCRSGARSDVRRCHHATIDVASEFSAYPFQPAGLSKSPFGVQSHAGRVRQWNNSDQFKKPFFSGRANQGGVKQRTEPFSDTSF